MAKQTIAQRLIAVLEKHGCERVTARTNKYTVLTRPAKPGNFYFVGKAGALRTGKTVSSSISIENTKVRLLREAEESCDAS